MAFFANIHVYCLNLKQPALKNFSYQKEEIVVGKVPPSGRDLTLSTVNIRFLKEPVQTERIQLPLLQSSLYHSSSSVAY